MSTMHPDDADNRNDTGIERDTLVGVSFARYALFMALVDVAESVIGHRTCFESDDEKRDMDRLTIVVQKLRVTT